MIGINEQKLPWKRKLRTQIKGKFNAINSADENKWNI
jgi:hypothetical protein